MVGMKAVFVQSILEGPFWQEGSFDGRAVFAFFVVVAPLVVPGAWN